MQVEPLETVERSVQSASTVEETKQSSPSVGVGRTLRITTVSLTSKMHWVRMVNGQISNNIGYVCYK